MNSNLKENSNKNLVVSVLLFCLLVVIASFSFFTNASPLISNSGSIKDGLKQIIIALPAIALDTGILLLGYYYGKQKHNHQWKLALRFWLLLWSVGLVIVVLRWLLLDNFVAANLTNALLPVTRNLSAPASGVIIGLVFQRVIGLNSRSFKKWSLFILGILTVNFPFSTNQMGLSANNPLFYSGLFVLGACAVPLLTNQLSRKKTWLLALASFVITAFVLLIMPQASFTANDGHIPVSVSRFSAPYSLLIVLVSLLITTLIIQYLPTFLNQEWQVTSLFITLIAAMDQSAIQSLTTLATKLAGHQSAFNVIWSGLLAGLIIGICSIIFTNVWLAYSRYARKNSRWLFNENPDSLGDILKHLKTTLFNHRQVITFFLLACLLSIASMFLIVPQKTVYTTQSFLTIPYLIFGRTYLWLLTAVLLTSIWMIIWTLSNRFWISSMTVSLLVGVVVVADHIKISLRNEPIMPTEVKMVNAYGSILKMVSPWIIISALVLIVIAECVAILLDHHYPLTKKHHRQSRTWAIIICILLFSSASFWNEPNGRFKTFMDGLGNQPSFFYQTQGARVNGPVVQFMNNIDIRFMAKPSGYSKQSMLKIKHHYQKVANQINEHRQNKLNKQTIVFILSESLSNPNRVPGVKLDHNPLPRINQIKQQNTGGLMLSSGFGGGTANMEYMTLTGFALCNFSPDISMPYTQVVPQLKHHPTIVNSFKYAVGIHPFYAIYYDRIQNYKKFGFNRFYYLGSKYKIRHKKYVGHITNLSDYTAYANTIDAIKRHHGGQFINLMTMQNHMPYNVMKYADEKSFNGQISAGTNRSNLEKYSAGINKTDQETQSFINQINKIPKPITVVFYGDHLPATIYGNSMAKDGLKLHETDYFIYSNKYAHQHGAHNLTKQHSAITSPNDFIAMAAAQSNSKVTWYQAMLTDLWNNLPSYVVNTDGSSRSAQFLNNQGKIVPYKSLNSKQRRMWHDYKLVQYDVVAGHHYSELHNTLN